MSGVALAAADRSTCRHCGAEVMPQYRDVTYRSGDSLECPHGEGARLVAWTTWGDGHEEIERRMYRALRAVNGRECFDLADRVEQAVGSRRPRRTSASTSGRRARSSRPSSSPGALRDRSHDCRVYHFHRV